MQAIFGKYLFYQINKRVGVFYDYRLSSWYCCFIFMQMSVHEREAEAAKLGNCLHLAYYLSLAYLC